MRYLQQNIVDEIGVKGQRNLSEAKVLIAGAGGLGTPVATYLAAMGIGTVGLVDFDVIQETNLHRQFAYTPTDIGKPKTEVLAARLRIQNPEIQINCYDERLTLDNATKVIQQYDLICDCTDNVATRLLLDKTCNELNKMLIYGAVIGWQGYVSILHGSAGIGLTDIFSEADLLFESQNSCSVSGVVSTVCGIIGTHQANEALKIIIGLESNLDGAIFCYDGLNNSSKILRLKRFQPIL
jgi:molybdopterin/thiamine biosynthesis adenylyltransferase